MFSNAFINDPYISTRSCLEELKYFLEIVMSYWTRKESFSHENICKWVVVTKFTATQRGSKDRHRKKSFPSNQQQTRQTSIFRQFSSFNYLCTLSLSCWLASLSEILIKRSCRVTVRKLTRDTISTKKSSGISFNYRTKHDDDYTS